MVAPDLWIRLWWSLSAQPSRSDQVLVSSLSGVFKVGEACGWCAGLRQHSQRSFWAHVSLGTGVWTLKIVSYGGRIAEMSSFQGKMGARAAPSLQSASKQRLCQQDYFPHLHTCSHRCHRCLMMVSFFFLCPHGGSSHSPTCLPDPMLSWFSEQGCVFFSLLQKGTAKGWYSTTGKTSQGPSSHSLLQRRWRCSTSCAKGCFCCSLQILSSVWRLFL